MTIKEIVSEAKRRRLKLTSTGVPLTKANADKIISRCKQEIKKDQEEKQREKEKGLSYRWTKKEWENPENFNSKKAREHPFKTESFLRSTSDKTFYAYLEIDSLLEPTSIHSKKTDFFYPSIPKKLYCRMLDCWKKNPEFKGPIKYDKKKITKIFIPQKRFPVISPQSKITEDYHLFNDIGIFASGTYKNRTIQVSKEEWKGNDFRNILPKYPRVFYDSEYHRKPETIYNKTFFLLQKKNAESQ